MPKLPIVRGKQLIRALEKLGFAIDHVSGSHYVLYHESTNRRAVVPFHRTTIPKGTMMAILRSAGITKEELREML